LGLQDKRLRPHSENLRPEVVVRILAPANLDRLGMGPAAVMLRLQLSAKSARRAPSTKSLLYLREQLWKRGMGDAHVVAHEVPERGAALADR